MGGGGVEVVREMMKKKKRGIGGCMVNRGWGTQR